MLKCARFVVAKYFVTIAVAVLLAAPCLLQAQQPPKSPDVYGQIKYRYIGPEGNRATSVAGVPGKPNIWYVGAASGGIFKSADGGIHWDPIFDSELVASIGSLAVAASDPNIVWAGTGESFIRSHISVGQGIYKSLDAGKTWSLMGLEKAGRIGRVEIDPRNPDVVLACALGHAYGPQPDRGVFRTTDGGKSWDKVLFVDENTGCSDLGVDPNNPRILFAGMWQIEIHTWGRTSGGPGSGLFKSTDGGATSRHPTRLVDASPKEANSTSRAHHGWTLREGRSTHPPSDDPGRRPVPPTSLFSRIEGPACGEIVSTLRGTSGQGGGNVRRVVR